MILLPSCGSRSSNVDKSGRKNPIRTLAVCDTASAERGDSSNKASSPKNSPFFQFRQRKRAVIQRIQLDMNLALFNDIHTDAGLILIENGFSFFVFPYMRITGNGRQFLAIQRLKK